MRSPTANGDGNVITNVSGSSVAIWSGLPLTSSPCFIGLAVLSSYTAASENATSSEVNAWPSEKVMFGRSFTV